MKGLRGVVSFVVLAGCAKGGSPALPPGDDVPDPDAPEQIADARPDGPPIDARPDAPPPPPPDAAIVPPDACVPTNSQLLLNPVFDLANVGESWVQTPIDAQFPLVTDQDGIPEHSAPFKAWLGGLEAPNVGQNVTDILTQDVTVPPLTSALVLTGQFEVRTGETDPTAFDTASLSVTQTDGTPIVTILSLSNLTPTTAYTPINFAFPMNLSGQTIRIRMTSSNDFFLATSFYFDTFSIVATHGCP